MKTIKVFFSTDKLASFILYFSILTFIIAFNFSDNPKSGWYQQFLPTSLPGITDITFTDSLTGYALTTVDAENSSYIIKTTNGGDIWNVIFRDSSGREFTKIKFINNNIGFACTKWLAGTAKLLKTTNGGDFWFALNNPATEPSYLDLCVLSEEELWCTDDLAFDGGVYRTTNGGVNWQRKYYDISHGTDRIYMINSRIGFISDGDNYNSFLKKTTSAGDSWIDIPNGDGWFNITFLDSLIGWRSLFQNDNFQKTTNGGLNWVTLINVVTGNPTFGITSFTVLNDTIWGVNPSGNILYPNNQYRGVIFRTTNAGINWGFQLPDTSFRIPFFNFCKFVNPNVGWAYSGVHTITGGDTITYPLTSIVNHNVALTHLFKLFQNYPNPFNPNTIISYDLRVTSFVKLKVFTVQGKEIKTLINQKQGAGEYKIEFNAHELPSGVYIYSLFLDNAKIDTKKMLLIK